MTNTVLKVFYEGKKKKEPAEEHRKPREGAVWAITVFLTFLPTVKIGT